jgi:uncharacterized membrane protein
MKWIAEMMKRYALFQCGLASISLGMLHILYGMPVSGALLCYFGCLIFWRDASGNWDVVFGSVFLAATSFYIFNTLF